MAAEILDGRALATRIEAELRAEVETFATMFGRRPRLVVVLVGDVAASASYVKGKAAAATRVGIESEVVAVPGTATTAELVALVEGKSASGLPTISLRPTITACRPAASTPASISIRCTPAAVQGTNRGRPCESRPALTG